jgi:uncharacterized repeat protein (TIGR03943 family)
VTMSAASRNGSAPLVSTAPGGSRGAADHDRDDLSGDVDQMGSTNLPSSRDDLWTRCVVGAVGVICIRLAFGHEAQNYVRSATKPLLGIGGVVLLGAALVAARRPATDDPEPHHDHASAELHEPAEVHEHRDHGHHHHHSSWLTIAVIVPLMVLFMLAPGPLGSFAARRSTTVVSAGDFRFDPLPPSGAPVPISQRDALERAVDTKGRTLDGRMVELTGFVIATGDGTFDLARFQIACCAADGVAWTTRLSVASDSGLSVNRDGWYRVVAKFDRLLLDDQPPLFTALSVDPVATPTDPYEGS